ncbi:hypothetical protein SNEBB_011015 [Seison nebaliae]|nr:hypothetical protein SNEBB_011015 [Seison nebaliae]
MESEINTKEIQLAYDNVRDDKSNITWAIFTYENIGDTKKTLIKLLTSGEEYGEMLNNLKEDLRCFIYIRMKTGDELSVRSKFAFISWCGSEVNGRLKIRLNIDKTNIKKIVRSFAIEVYATELDDLEEETVRQLIEKSSGACCLKRFYDENLTPNLPISSLQRAILLIVGEFEMRNFNLILLINYLWIVKPIISLGKRKGSDTTIAPITNGEGKNILDQFAFHCPGEGYYPDPYSCVVYYLCTNGEAAELRCGENLAYNAQRQMCDWDEKVDCKRGRRPMSYDLAGVTLWPTRKTFRPPRLKKTTKTPLKINTNFTCPWEADGFFTDPYSCTVYHYCAPGVHTVLQCMGGLWYSEELENCVWPSETTCKSAPTTTPNPFTTTEVAVPGWRTTPKVGQVYGLIDCPEGVAQFFPDPHDCSAYHFCNGGIDQVLLCESGLFYDRIREVCDWRKNVDCKHKCPSTGQRFKFVHPESCCEYFECVSGELRSRICPYPQLFSVETKQCEIYQMVNCGIRKSCKLPCDYDHSPLCAFTPKCENQIDGYYIDQFRPACKYYYVCKEERTLNYTTCPIGYRFNEELKMCDKFKEMTLSPGTIAGIVAGGLGAVVAVGSGVFIMMKHLSKEDRKVMLNDRKMKYPCKLLRKEVVNHDTRIYTFALPSDEHCLGLPVGKHINLIARINGELVVRAYTPITNDDNKGYFNVMVKTYMKEPPKFPEGGKMSLYLDSLKIGDCIEVRGPNGFIEYMGNGSFNLLKQKRTKTFRNVALIAGGTGVTPMLQLMRYVAKHSDKDQTKLSLLFANKTEKDILLRNELMSLSENYQNQIKVSYTLDEVDDDDWPYAKGFINEEMIRKYLPPPGDDTLVMICGPPPMVKFACLPNLEKLGYSSENIYTY